MNAGFFPEDNLDLVFFAVIRHPEPDRWKEEANTCETTPCWEERMIDELIATLEIVRDAVRAKDKDKGFEAVTIFLLQLMTCSGIRQVSS
jgi:hypothetical protein